MPSRISRALLLVVLGFLGACTGYSQTLHKTNSVEATLYDPDPGHIANRVYKELYSWKGDEEAAPSRWPKQNLSVDLVNLKSVLDELLQINVGKEFPDAVKRVFLQRDLWLMFDWLAQQPSGSENPVIQRKLARGIQHLALPLVQLRQLPDNYNEQLTSDAYPTEFDVANPKNAFLPGGLWLRNGPWIMVGDRERGILTAQHLDFFRGHNAYMVFLRLPAGRDATILYLNNLNNLTPSATSHGRVAELPEGSQVALVSQVVAIDDKGMPFPTTITDNVQLRVYRQPKNSLTKANDAQARFEFRLDRAALFAHNAASLRPVGAKEVDWEIINQLGQKKTDSEGKAPIMASCFDCHNEAGVNSFRTFSEMRGGKGHLRQMTLSTRSDEVGRTVVWKKHQLDYQLLRQFWAE